MRITKKQLRRIVKEEAEKLKEQPQQMTLNQSGDDAVLAMADQIDPMFQILRKTAGQSDVSFDPLFEEVEEILLDLPSYLREIAKKMKAQGVEGGLKEQMDHYEWRHQEDQKDLADHRADEVFDIIDQDEGLPGREVVARALRSSVFGGAAEKDVYTSLDVLVDAGDVVLDAEEDAWYVTNSKEHRHMLDRNAFYQE